MSGLLPEGFAALEPYVARWSGETAAARAHLRDSASFAEAEAFYTAAQPLVEPALAYLDANPLANNLPSPVTHGGVRRHEQGPNQTGIQIRRLDDLLRFYASRGHGQ